MTFYEDFPYAWWNDFTRLDDLGPDALLGPPARRLVLTPTTPTSPTSSSGRSRGITIYASQIERLFGGNGPDGRRRSAPTGRDGRRSRRPSPGYAERYWASTRL